MYADRKAATQRIMRHFDPSHLPAELQPVSGACRDMAEEMLELLEDGDELLVGLRRLLEAKDCFVRQAVADGALEDVDE